MIQTIIDVIPGFIEVTFLYILLNSCCEGRCEFKYIYVVWVILDLGILMISKLVSSTADLEIIICIVMEIVLTKIMFKGKILLVFFWVACFNSISGIFDIATYIATVSVLHAKLEQVVSLHIINNTAAFLSKLMLWAVVMRLKNFLCKSDYKYNRYLTPLLIVPIVSMSAMIIINDYSLNVVGNTRKTVLIYVTVAGLFFMNILVFYIYERLYQMSYIKEEISLMEQQQVYQQKYFRQLERSYQEIRGIKHDINRHITLIHTLAQSGEYEKLIEYTEELSNSTVNIIKIVQTGNTILDAIINEKYSIAKSLGFEINFIVDKISQNIINPTSLCVIASNVLDNAIEGCSKIEETKLKPQIEVKLYLQKNNLIFSVINDTKENNDKSGLLITSKPNKKEHGIGLKNVKKVIEENKGNYELGYSLGKFIFVCRIPLSAQKLHQND